jgi:hypothetical protein
MKNKIVFIAIILFTIIFGFSMTSCNNKDGGTLEVINATDVDIYFIVFNGTSSLSETNKKIDELNAPEKAADKAKYIKTINSDNRENIPFDGNTFITYKWWTTNDELFDFGSRIVEKGNTVTITAKNPQ